MTNTTDLNNYLQLLASEEPGERLLDFRWRNQDARVQTGGMHQTFLLAARAPAHAGRLQALAARCDVYVGVALRDRRAGGKLAISGSHLLWCEIDSYFAHLSLRRAVLPPTAVIASGGPGHLHAYWKLTERAAPLAVEAANRALAEHLGGDRASTDVARILRPPGTLNHKRHLPAPVQLLEQSPERVYELGAVIAGLRDPRTHELADQQRRTARTRERRLQLAGSSRAADVNAALKALRPAQWVAAITADEPNRDGKVICPCHADHTPSLHLYEDGAWCYAGCGAVDIYDYAAGVWGLSTNGGDFLQLRDRLARELLGINPAASASAGKRVAVVARRSGPISNEPAHRSAAMKGSGR